MDFDKLDDNKIAQPDNDIDDIHKSSGELEAHNTGEELLMYDDTYLYSDDDLIEPSETFNETEKHNIYLSYSHNNRSTADEIDKIIGEILRNQYNILRDERELGYKSSIKQFMNMIPEQDYVLMLVSNAYLVSENCMYEVLETMRNHNYKEKMLFIILDDAKIYEPDSLSQYQKYWNDIKIQKENEIVEVVSQRIFGALGYLSEQWKKIMKINIEISEFIQILKDEKGFNYNDLLNNKFKPIIDYIAARGA